MCTFSKHKDGDLRIRWAKLRKEVMEIVIFSIFEILYEFRRGKLINIPTHKSQEGPVATGPWNGGGGDGSQFNVPFTFPW
jgi:hypothetical protein